MKRGRRPGAVGWQLEEFFFWLRENSEGDKGFVSGVSGGNGTQKLVLGPSGGEEEHSSLGGGRSSQPWYWFYRTFSVESKYETDSWPKQDLRIH